MAMQTFIYNSSSPTGAHVDNPFTVEKTALIRAAGLTEPVTIYMAVGVCHNCRAEDMKWEPVMHCGAPLQISPDHNRVVIAVPGKYALGNPSQPAIVLAGDVNITKEEGIVPSQVTGNPCGAPPCEPLTGGLQTSW